ncbi:MAG: beta-ketoacyl synthase [Paludibacteraceae bacterium]|nr:beta-ketoacyl synthase [Paludibacteraceae bacterium]MBN2788370.1 beta-ketoacyl synthase [Paludibacteraceae bacterium]
MAVVYKKADNIITSLGFSTAENFEAVVNGISGLSYHPEGTLGVPEAFYASIIDTSKIEEAFAQISKEGQLTRFEKLAILSVYKACSNIDIDLSSNTTLFVLSTTKGNVGLLEKQNENDFNNDALFLSHSAKVIAQFFGNNNNPITISNACISGVSAQIVAKRLLNTGKYKHAVVVGLDELTKFIISGFQSFKALSVDACKPFDANRIGLNLGEGVGTVILSVTEDESTLPKGTIVLENGAITNDANHISGPSRTGEGLFLALQNIMQGRKTEEIGFINAHGTATPYNDEMESIALTRAGLQSVPTNSLKSYFGHTLGAAGLIETIISSEAMLQNKLIKSLGYETCGVSMPLQIITQTTSTEVNKYIKMVSGFGGCNAAVMMKKIG